MTRRASASIDQSPLVGAARTAWEESLLAKAATGSQNHVLQTLLRFAWGKADIFPTEAAIASKCGKSPRTVRRVIGELRATGLLAIVTDRSIHVQRRIVFPSHPNAEAVLRQFPDHMQGGQNDQIETTCRGDKKDRCRGDISCTCRGDKMTPRIYMGESEVGKKRKTLKPPPRSATPAPRVRAGGEPGGGEVAISIVQCRVIGCPGGEACAAAVDKAEWRERCRRWEKGGHVGPPPAWTSRRPMPDDVHEIINDREEPPPPRWTGEPCDGRVCCEACSECWDRIWGPAPLPELPIALWQVVEEIVACCGEDLRGQVVRGVAFARPDEGTLWAALDWLRTRRRRPRGIHGLTRLLDRLRRAGVAPMPEPLNDDSPDDSEGD